MPAPPPAPVPPTNTYPGMPPTNSPGAISTVSITQGANIIQGDSNLGWFVIHRTNSFGTLTVNYSAPTGGAKVGVADGPLSTSAGSVTFLPGQTDIPLLFQADGVAPGTSVSVQVFGSQVGAYLLNFAAAMVVINLDAGMNADADETPRTDLSTKWHNLLSNPNNFLVDDEAIIEVMTDIHSIADLTSEHFTRSEMAILARIAEGGYDTVIGQFSRTLDLKALAVATHFTVRNGFWTLTPRGCRDHSTTADLTAAIAVLIPDLTNPAFATRDAASRELTRLASHIRLNGDTIQMEAMANILYGLLATQSNQELAWRVDDLVEELLPLAIDKRFYQLVHPLAEWLRHPTLP